MPDGNPVEYGSPPLVNARLFLRYWLPVIVWTAVILAASSDLFAARETGSTLRDILRFILGRDLAPETFGTLHFVIRKAAHLIEYAILGALTLRALRQGDAWTWRRALAAVALAALVATADEGRQSTVASRTGSPVDVAIDIVGAATAVAAVRRRAGAAGGRS